MLKLEFFCDTWIFNEFSLYLQHILMKLALDDEYLIGFLLDESLKAYCSLDFRNILNIIVSFIGI